MMETNTFQLCFNTIDKESCSGYEIDFRIPISVTASSKSLPLYSISLLQYRDMVFVAPQIWIIESNGLCRFIVRFVVFDDMIVFCSCHFFSFMVVNYSTDNTVMFSWSILPFVLFTQPSVFLNSFISFLSKNVPMIS